MAEVVAFPARAPKPEPVIRPLAMEQPYVMSTARLNKAWAIHSHTFLIGMPIRLPVKDD